MPYSDAAVETGACRSFTLGVVTEGPAKPLTPATYKAAFIARVRLAREAAGVQPKTVATALGLKYNTYMQYEDPKKGSMMPHNLVGTFCRLCGCSIAWLMDNQPDPFQEADSGVAPKPTFPASEN